MQDLREESGLALAPSPSAPRRSAQLRPRPRPARLERFVVTEILPRLFDAHPPAPAEREALPVPLDALVEALLAVEGGRSAAFEQDLSARCSTAQYMLDALAPAARRLGELWQEDACDFFDVTQGVSRLQAMLARVETTPRRRAGLTMLLLTAPGETHGFGADMAAELFRYEGWRVERGEASQLPRLGQRRYDALGVSCACERAYDALPAFLAAARQHSPQIKTLVGGAFFVAHPAAASHLGADFAATDKEAARRISRALIGRQHL